MGSATRRVHTPSEEAGEFPLIHLVEDCQPGVVGAVVEFWHHGIGLFQRGVQSEHGPE